MDIMMYYSFNVVGPNKSEKLEMFFRLTTKNKR